MSDNDKVLTAENTYNAGQVLRWRDEISETCTNSRKGRVPGVDDRDWGEELAILMPSLVDIFSRVLSIGASITEQSLDALLSRCHDGYPTIEDVKFAAWVMAGNYRTLRLDVPVEPFTAVIKEEWVPVHVIDYRRTVVRGNPGGY